MTHRSEKPSATESSTDTLIGALNIIADLLDTNPDQQYMIEAISVREAAQRLDKLEKELEQLRQTKTLRDEFAMQALNGLLSYNASGYLENREARARVSYEYADAMMEARK